uniref:LAGLIDADG homing endonuclease n=1 Tax=Globodera rostochiensis TaxID=31243 RepID=A0A914I5B4_GLORO
MRTNSVTIVAKKTLNLPNELEHRSYSTSSALAHFSMSANFSQLSISPTRWTLWRFDCHDLPNHCSSVTCPFCVEVNKLRLLSNKDNLDDGHDRWETYLERVNCFDNQQTLLRVANAFLPSKLAKSVFFNYKLGVAIFRENIPPKYESAKNIDGGIFELQLATSSGRLSVETVQKFDALFSQSLSLMFGLPFPIACHVHGLFYRCEVNPGKKRLAYRNQMDLPFIAKLEVWIDHQQHKTLVKESLINAIKNVINELEIPILRSFHFRINYFRARNLKNKKS